MPILTALAVIIRDRAALKGGGRAAGALGDAIHGGCAGRAYQIGDQAADPRGQLAPQPRNAVDDALDDVLADVAPLVHAAVPHADQLGDAGQGGFGQIFEAADDTLCQGGQKLGTAREDVRQVLDQSGGKFGNQSGGTGNERGQVVCNAGDKALHKLHTGVHNGIRVVAEVVHKSGDHLGGAGDQVRGGVNDALHQSAQHFGCCVQHRRCSCHDVLGQLGDDLHAGGHQPR